MSELIEAAFAGDAERVEALLAAGADPEDTDENGTTPLYAAAVAGQAAAARALLGAGADPDRASVGESEGTPLCAAACWGYAEVAAELLAAGATVDRPEPDGPTALVWAALGGHAQTAHVLLAAGADPDLEADGWVPLPVAAQTGSLAIVRDLLAHGADREAADRDGRTALMIADAWRGKDVEEELRGRFQGRASEIVTRREPRPDGIELVEVIFRRADGSTGTASCETGHDRIASLLREE